MNFRNTRKNMNAAKSRFFVSNEKGKQIMTNSED